MTPCKKPCPRIKGVAWIYSNFSLLSTFWLNIEFPDSIQKMSIVYYNIYSTIFYYIGIQRIKDIRKSVKFKTSIILNLCQGRRLYSEHSCMPSPLAPDPIRVQPCVWCLFWTNRNCMAVTSIFLSISLSNQSYEFFNRRKWKYYFYLNLQCEGAYWI